MTTINSIIERLTNNGSGAVLEDWVSSAKSKTDNYGKISGMMWGLYATGFISSEERKKAIDEIIDYLYKAADLD